LSLKITLGLKPSCNFLATNTRLSGLLEKISGNISVPWYIIYDNKTETNNGIPIINEIKEFWSNIWSNEVQFNNQAEWIPHLENDIPDSNNRHHIQISLKY
jgi:HSP90 family molecular chaperone